MNEQLKLQQLLTKKFLEMKSKNKNFSVRALASKLQMQPGATNEILKGQRRVSRKIAEKIADRLMLDPSERAELLKDFPNSLRRNTEVRKTRTSELEALKLNSDQFTLISDWTHFAILSLIRVKNFRCDISWIADRLVISEVEVRKALLRLQSLKLITIAEGGLITRTNHPIRTTDDIKDLSIQRMHINDMEMAKDKIQKVDVRQRDFTNFTFPANPESLNRAKEIIRRAQDELEELMNDENANEVYRVCMYLFPLTKIEETKKERS